MGKRRRLDPFDKRAGALSIALHGALLSLLWASTLVAVDATEFVTYQIEIVSPPPANFSETPQDAAEELVVERPDPEPTPPDPTPTPEETVEILDEEPETTEEEPAPEQPPEVADEAVEATSDDEPTDDEPDETGQGIEVRMEGLRRDYPAYYERIIYADQSMPAVAGRWAVGRRFCSSRLSVTGLLRTSTSTSGRGTLRSTSVPWLRSSARVSGRFGPLPEDLPYERFPDPIPVHAEWTGAVVRF